jgi:hypothetical protein
MNREKKRVPRADRFPRGMRRPPEDQVLRKPPYMEGIQDRAACPPSGRLLLGAKPGHGVVHEAGE